jgi:Na+-driven multidrug efflux pump
VAAIGVFQLYHLFNEKSTIKLKWDYFRVDWRAIRSLLSLAAPVTLQFFIGSCSWIILTALVAHTGKDVASAGYQTAIRVVIFFILPAWGISNAAATLVGQNLGAKQPERAEISVKRTAKYSAIFMGVVSLVFLFGAELIISFFTSQPEVVNYAVVALRIISAGYIFYGIGMVMMNAFNGERSDN